MLAAAALSGVYAAEKSIVVYFSHTGENYAVGNITEGNTAKVAKVIAAKTGAELYEIKEAKPYPANYQACVDLAQKELRSNARPELAGKLPDLSAYSVIYLGYPNWWGDAPMVVYSFLDKVKIDGKNIIPFCTHEGSGLGSTARKLAKAFPKAKVVQDGLSLRGATAQRDAAATEEAVVKWLKSLGKIK
ncbi:MAG: flavodoxin [Lentisphaeria bacterium]|nr:flavodoxin [Lentisphaeria bacterium]